MVAEAAVAITAGLIAASIALVGFGLDSVIELFSAAIVIWQLRGEIAGQDRQTRAVRLIGVTFFALAAYLTVDSIRDLATAAVGQVPPLHLPVPLGDVGRVGQFGVGPLPVPHLPPGVPRVAQDRGDSAQRPRRADRCGFRAGSAADGHGTPASFSARAIRATLCPASRCANIHLTTCAVSGSGSRRCARRPHAACALFGCGPASASRYPYGGRPPRYRPCRVCSAIAVRTLMLVLVISRLDERPSIVIAHSSCSQP